MLVLRLFVAACFLGRAWEFRDMWPLAVALTGGATLALFARKENRWMISGLIAGGAVMAGIAAANGPMSIISRAIQWAAPVILVAVLLGWRWKLAALFAIAGTFAGHALKAVGILPTPAYFADMIRAVVPVEPAPFLLFFGIADLIACALIFHPKTRYWGLFYMAVWGVAVALARFTLPSIDGVAVRLIYGGLPLFLLMESAPFQRMDPAANSEVRAI